MKNPSIIALALACALVGWLAGYNSAGPNEGRWVATGPKNLFVLDTHTGEVKSSVPPAEPEPEPEWSMSCKATREYLLKSEQERQELAAERAQIDEAIEERQRRDPLQSFAVLPRHTLLLTLLIANREGQESAREFLAENCE